MSAQVCPSTVLTNSSLLIVESLARAGADSFVGYPITPANLLYLYASKRFRVFSAAPDEITTLQLMSGYAAAGRIPVTATSFPGYALMIEGINMAVMMELPMVIVLVQRLGPATGTATLGSQGDISLLQGTISGGMALPAFSISSPVDCWELSAEAVEVAVRYRTPVVIFTSKEEVMTQYSLDLQALRPISKVKRTGSDGNGQSLVPPLHPVTRRDRQVRFTASTHDVRGIIQNASQEGLDNSVRLHRKVVESLPQYTHYDLDEQAGADDLIVSFGITAQAAREAIAEIRESGGRASLLVAKTLLPVPKIYYEICSRYKRVFYAEENLTGQYRQLMYGANPPERIRGINQFGRMITPGTIKEAVRHE
jgi:2-oxoglutarate ferredoxin oxidoreductase subunit alpha